ncbi:MAG: transcriptional repressor LexA [Patescibacteria group bacterium]|nr:transcriptional repressor LexA [Patescibacteria group bacterium]
MSPARPLTHKQKRVLDNIRLYIGARGEPPTLDELRMNLGFKSLRTVTQYLESLEMKGYIARRKHARRNIELIDGSTPHTIMVPVVGNVGCDDLSVFAQEEHDEYLEVDPDLAPGEDIVAVRAVGDSMLDAGIHSGDYVLIRFTEKAETGDRVAAIVGDMITVKRLERRADATVLWPENKDPKYKPIILRSDFKIAGKVLCVIPQQTAAPSDVVPLSGYEHI